LNAATGQHITDAAERKLVAAHEALRHTRGLQFDFAAAPAPPAPPAWLRALVEALQVAAPVLKYVFWGGVIAGLAWLVWVMVRDMAPSGWRVRRRWSDVVDWRPDAAAARTLLADADGLAADGRYGEAVHLLLFRSIEELAANRPGSVRAALTSRDIVAAAPIPPGPREAFARIARTVERSFFGGRMVDAEEFAARRDDYETFAFSEAWR
jgi:hypothetical protein